MSKQNRLSHVMALLLAALLALAGAACAPLQTAVPPTATPHPTPMPTASPAPDWDYWAAPIDWQNPVEVKYGETVTLHGGGLKITFVEVADSRCAYAEGIQCVWEGNAEVRLHVQRADDPAGTEMVLNTSGQFAQGATYSGYDIILDTLEPNLADVVDPAKGAYSASLTVLLR